MTVTVGKRTGRSAAVQVTAVSGGGWRQRPDTVVTEEPLEIRACGPGQAPALVGVVMRTPGHDFELTTGWLLFKGILQGPDSVAAVRYGTDDGGEQLDLVIVEARHPLLLDRHTRPFSISSAHWLGGTAALDEVERRCAPAGPGVQVSAELLMRLPSALRSRQRLFAETGGLHGAGVFGEDSRALAVREDVGQHNAVDKLVGWAALERRLPLDEAILVVSGGTGVEVVQKAALAGITVVVGVSAPSSRAVELARRLGVTLAGFARGERANIYSGEERVALPA